MLAGFSRNGRFNRAIRPDLIRRWREFRLPLGNADDLKSYLGFESSRCFAIVNPPSEDDIRQIYLSKIREDTSDIFTNEEGE
jgi:hypothetical protein